jgi:hypothetical protein
MGVRKEWSRARSVAQVVECLPRTSNPSTIKKEKKNGAMTMEPWGENYYESPILC